MLAFFLNRSVKTFRIYFILFGFQNFRHPAYVPRVDDFSGQHQTPGMHSCPHCPFKAKRLDSLKRHMRRHFPSEKYICNICEKGFLENYFLKCHLLKAHGITASHSEQKSKKCICNICGNGYVENYILKHHMLTVHGIELSVNVESQALNVESQTLNVESPAGKELTADNLSDAS